MVVTETISADELDKVSKWRLRSEENPGVLSLRKQLVGKDSEHKNKRAVRKMGREQKEEMWRTR